MLSNLLRVQRALTPRLCQICLQDLHVVPLVCVNEGDRDGSQGTGVASHFDTV